MSSVRTVLVIVFVVTLGAGVVAGMLVSRFPQQTTQPAGNGGLADELKLTAAQREQMRQIWEGVRDEAQDCQRKAQSLQSQRDEAVLALLNDQQREQYKDIARKYAEGCASLAGRRDTAFEKAVARTKQMLTEPQQRHYEQILKARVGAGPGERFRQDGPPGSDASPALGPVASPQRESVGQSTR